MPEKWAKNEKLEKWTKKGRIFTRQTVFALICTVFIGFAWKSRFQLDIENTSFGILWPNIHNFFYNNLFRAEVNKTKIPTKIKNHFDAKKKIIVKKIADVRS